MAQQVKAAATKAHDPLPRHARQKEEPTLASCPLSSTHALWHSHTIYPRVHNSLSHKNIHTCNLALGKLK